MTTLQGKKIVIVGGSSGIGYSVAKASLLSLAEHVLIASSSLPRVDTAVTRLLAEPVLQEQTNLQQRLAGEVLDIRDTQAVRTFFDKIGEIDHLIITAGNISLQFEFQNEDLDKLKSECYAPESRLLPPLYSCRNTKMRSMTDFGDRQSRRKRQRSGQVDLSFSQSVRFHQEDPQQLHSLVYTLCRQLSDQATSKLVAHCQSTRLG